MSSYTPNYGLYKPGADDPLDEFMAHHNTNMDIIDQNLGGGGGGGSSTLAGLTDVVLNALQDGQFLRYDSLSGKWVNADGDAVALNDITDVNLSNPTDGQILVYDSASGKWVNATITLPDMNNYYTKTQTDGLLANKEDLLPSHTSADATKVLTVGSNGNLLWAASGGGGGGGDTVTWNQIVTSGTKVATISINGVPTDVYAPNGGDTVAWSQLLSSGTKIATVTINGVPTDIYAPAGEQNVQANWNETNTASDAYIQNKPQINGHNLSGNMGGNSLGLMNVGDVEANPSGAAGTTLTKLGIGGSIYSIPSGGGGGGGSLQCATLLDDASGVGYNSDVTHSLSDDIDNYVMLLFVSQYVYRGKTYWFSSFVPVSFFKTTTASAFLSLAYGTNLVQVWYASDTSIKTRGSSSTMSTSAIKVYGIKVA